MGVSGQAQFAAVGGRDVHVNHLNGREFLEQAARRQPGRQSLQANRLRSSQNAKIAKTRDESAKFG
jgi:hypothetical protein